MQRWGYTGTIRDFLSEPAEQVFGKIASQSAFADLVSQKAAWLAEIELLRKALDELSETPGAIYFEYTIPRLGGRADVILLLGQVLFVIEFKTGADQFTRDAIDQVWDYALDLKNFHETSHHVVIVPVLVATEAVAAAVAIAFQADDDHLTRPVCV